MATRNIPSKTNTSLKKSTFNFPKGGNCPPCPPARYGPGNCCLLREDFLSRSSKNEHLYFMKTGVEKNDWPFRTTEALNVQPNFHS